MSGRRLALLLAAGAVWLAFAASVAADGGPHIAAVNNGSLGLTADNCAGCHRAHTASGPDLLASDGSTLCLSCHDGSGATTNVVDGYQFVPAGPSLLQGGHTGDTVLGGLRGGGFDFALIDSSHAARLIAGGDFQAKVGVLGSNARQATTSHHGGSGTVWGNSPDGTTGSGAGPATLECTSCHNPHGNGLYRILRPQPGEDFTTLGVAGWHESSNAVEVQDIAPCPAIGCVDPTTTVRNYTVLPGNTAADVAANYTALQGDYWRKRTPWNLATGAKDVMEVGWNGTSPTSKAANGGVAPSNAKGLMTAWCIQCHTRYSGLVTVVDGVPMSSSLTPQPDAVFTYRHLTANYGCEQCHVSHGSNAIMVGLMFGLEDPSGAIPAPIPSAGPSGSVTSADSRLLKVDGLGTCQLCHDPTRPNDSPLDGYVGPVPSPGIP